MDTSLPTQIWWRPGIERGKDELPILTALIGGDSAKQFEAVSEADAIQAGLRDLETMFGGLVAGLVKELTSDKDAIEKIGKKEYLSRKMETMSSYALVVKLADRLDNVQDIATAKTPEWRQKYKKETHGILARLEKNRTLSGTHKRIIKAIKDKLDEVE